MGLLKAFDQIVWGLIVFLVIFLIVVWIYLPYILGALAVWLAVNHFLTRHRMAQRASAPSLPPPQSPEDARKGKFTFKRIQIKKASSKQHEPLPLVFVLPNGAEIQRIK